jgi:hypothetical protein
MSDYIEDLKYYMDLWDQAVEDDLVPAVEKPRVPDTSYEDTVDSAQEDYWNYQVESLLQESRSANPVYLDSIGKDQDRPKPSWVNEDFLKEIEGLKKKVYDLECKVNKQDSGNGEWTEKARQQPNDKKLFSQLESLKKQIDNISNSLGIEDEPKISTWDFKE